MSNHHRAAPVVRAVATVVLATAMLAGSARGASAQEIIYGSTVPAGTTIDQDIILSGDEVRIDGTVLGDVIAIGGAVHLNGRVEGTMIAIAQDVELNGEVGGSLLTAALQLLFGPQGTVGRNLYFGGLSLVLPPGASVGRDLVAGTMGATLGGAVGRDVRAIVGPFEFARLIIGAAEEGDWLGKVQAWWESVRPEPLPEPPSAVPTPLSRIGSGGLMRLSQSPPWKATPTPASAPEAMASPSAPPVSEATGTGQALDSVLDWLNGRLLAFIPLACLGLAVLWLVPPSLTLSAARLRRKPWPTWLWGFLVFVVANQLFVVAAILTLLVIGVGVAVGLQSMWGFAFSIWALGLPAIGLAVGLLAVALYALSVVITSFAVVNGVIEPGEHYLRRAGVMLLGVLCLVLLAGIPILGTIIWAAAVAAGTGAMFFAYTDWRAARRGPATAKPVAPAAAPAPAVEPMAVPAPSAAPPPTQLAKPPSGAPSKTPASKSSRKAGK